MTSRFTPVYYQRGAATLLVTLLLMALILITSLTAGKVGILERKTVTADARVHEAKEAAEAGLEYGMAWLRVNKCNGGCANVTAARITTPTGYTYDPVVSFSANNDYVLVTSTAVANEEPAVNAISQQYARQTDFLTGKGKGAPPLVIDGCLTGVTGGPHIYPRPDGAAVLTLATNDPGDGTSAGCVDLGHFEIDMCSSGGTDATCTVADTSSVSEVTTPPDYLSGEDHSSDDEPHAWNYIFDIPLNEAKARAAAAGQVYSSDNAVPTGPASTVPFVVYTGSTPFNGSGSRVYGSVSEPVVLIMTDTGCPHLNGGVTVYGFVYYESDTGSPCNGWGGANVIGSVVLESDGANFNANSEFFDITNLGGGGGGVVFLDDIARIFGTWKDW